MGTNVDSQQQANGPGQRPKQHQIQYNISPVYPLYYVTLMVCPSLVYGDNVPWTLPELLSAKTVVGGTCVSRMFRKHPAHSELSNVTLYVVYTFFN